MEIAKSKLFETTEINGMKLSNRFIREFRSQLGLSPSKAANGI